MFSHYSLTQEGRQILLKFPLGFVQNRSCLCCVRSKSSLLLWPVDSGQPCDCKGEQTELVIPYRLNQELEMECGSE